MNENVHVLQGMLINVFGGNYVLPITCIKQSFKPLKKDVFSDPSGNEMIQVKGVVYNLVRLSDYLCPTNAEALEIEDGIVIIMEFKRRAICVFASALLGERQLPITPLPDFFAGNPYISGCAELQESTTHNSESELCLIINVEGFFDDAKSFTIESEPEPEEEIQVIDEPQTISEDMTIDKYFTFGIASEEYAVEIASIKEIIGVRKITKVPESPDHVEGIISLRGKIIPIVDLRKRFFKPSVNDSLTCIVVVEALPDSGIASESGEPTEKQTFGLIVDKVLEVVVMEESSIEPMPKASTQRGYSQFVSGIGRAFGKVKLLLDINKLVYKD